MHDNRSLPLMDRVRAQPRSRWAERRDIILTILGWIAVTFIAFEVLRRLSHVVLVAALAAVVAFAISPVVRFVERMLPRVLAITIVYLLFAVAICSVSFLIVNTGIHQLNSLSQTMHQLFAPSGSTGGASLTQLAQRLGMSQQQLDQINQQITQRIEDLAISVIPVATGVFNYLLDFVLIIVLSIYVLVDGERLVGLLQRNMPLSRRQETQFMLSTLQRVVGGYIRGQLLMSLIVGLLVWTGMSILGVPYPQLLGLLAFVLEFIPILGTLFSGITCVLLALTHGLLIALIALGYFVVIHIIEADVLGPRIVGKSLGLHPIVSILAVIAGSELGGVAGALFASPVAGIGQAILVAGWEHLKLTQPEQFDAGGEDGANADQDGAARESASGGSQPAAVMPE